MPLGPYRDFADCVRKNQAKSNPEAYCGYLEQQINGASMWVIADVTFDTDADAREAERLVREGKMAGVSVDLADVTSEIEILTVDEEGFPTDWLETVTGAEIIGATQVAMPAFADARIVMEDGGFVAYLAPEGLTTSDRRTISPHALTWRDPAPLMFNSSSDGHNGSEFVGNLTNFRRLGDMALVASNPNLLGLTKPHVQDGKIVGHGAAWGTCHTAFKNACVTAPSSTYRHVSDGVGIYRHPRGDIHAPLSLSLEDAARWYDAHCQLVGRASVGEDDFGIWLNGDSDLPDGDLFVSGDWRADDGKLELISFLVVENPGFPTAMVAADTQTALTSAGVVTQSDTTEIRLARLEAALFAPSVTEAEVEEAAEFWEVAGLEEVFG